MNVRNRFKLFNINKQSTNNHKLILHQENTKIELLLNDPTVKEREKKEEFFDMFTTIVNRILEKILEM